MEKYIWGIFLLAVSWFIITLLYQILNLLKLWLSLKLDEIKIKELKIWD